MTTESNKISLDASFSELEKIGVVCHRTQNALKSVGIITVGELVRKYSNLSDLMGIRNFGRRSFLDIENLMERVDNVQLASTKAKMEKLDTLTAEYEKLSDVKKACLGYIYKKKATDAHLPVRAQNALRRAKITILQVLKWGKDSDSAPNSILSIHHVGEGTYSTIVELCKGIYNDFNELMSLTDESAERYLFMTEFDFMLPSECKKCVDFKHANGHYPMFYILREYLKTSEMKRVQIFAQSHGISTYSPLSFADIASRMNYSLERVRQLHNEFANNKADDPMLNKITTHNDWNNYKDLLQLDYVSAAEGAWLSIRDNEISDTSFLAFAWIASLTGMFRVINIGNISYLQNKKISFDVNNFQKKVKGIISDKYYKDKVINLEKKFEMPDEATKKIAMIAIETLIAGTDIKLLSGNKLFIPKNQTNIDNDICLILKTNKGKMSLDEITEEFNRINKNIRQLDRENIRQHILRSNRISSCGYSGYYGLTEWSDVYYGTIRDLVFEILSESQLPVHIETIFDSVSSHFESTSLESITSSIQWDNAKRFVKFEEGYFGLTSKNYPDKFHKCIKKSILYPFDKRMEMFRDFVGEYHHYPFSGRGEVESMLSRWKYNIENDIINVTQEQKDLFYSMLEHYEVELIPRSHDEFTFYCSCQKYIDYIRDNETLPTNENGSDLLAWFNKAKETYLNYSDFRKDYFLELNKVLSF